MHRQRRRPTFGAPPTAAAAATAFVSNTSCRWAGAVALILVLGGVLPLLHAPAFCGNWDLPTDVPQEQSHIEHDLHPYGALPPRLGVSSELHRRLTYDDCPFRMTKFSQYELAQHHRNCSSSTTATSSNENDDTLHCRAHSLERALESLALADSSNAGDRLRESYTSGAWRGRQILLIGDSLTRQVFQALACRAHAWNMLEHHSMQVSRMPAGSSPTLTGAGQTQLPHVHLHNGQFTLRGGGTIIYSDGGLNERSIPKILAPLQKVACADRQTNVQAKASFTFPLGGSSSSSTNGEPPSVTPSILTLRKQDIVVFSYGGHENWAPQWADGLADLFRCLRQHNGNTTILPTRFWPHMAFHIASSTHFWTPDGNYDKSKILPGRDPGTCQSKHGSTKHRDAILRLAQLTQGGGEKNNNADDSEFYNPVFGRDLPLDKLGDLHPWHSDCLHWIMPGVPDVVAAELAAFVDASTARLNASRAAFQKQ